MPLKAGRLRWLLDSTTMKTARSPKTNGNNGAHAIDLPASRISFVRDEPAPLLFISIMSKRKAPVRLRLAAIDAVWMDAGSLDGPYFIQASGRTFHPNEQSFREVCAALSLEFPEEAAS